MPTKEPRIVFRKGFEGRFIRVWTGPGGVSFGFGIAVALFCGIFGFIAGLWELLVLSGVLVVVCVLAIAFAIFIEYGPLQFDPQGTQSVAAQRMNERINKGELHPGKLFVGLGLAIAIMACVVAVLFNAPAWTFALGAAGMILTTLAVLLEADVAVFRLGMFNKQREQRGSKTRK